MDKAASSVPQVRPGRDIAVRNEEGKRHDKRLKLCFVEMPENTKADLLIKRISVAISRVIQATDQCDKTEWNVEVSRRRRH